MSIFKYIYELLISQSLHHYHSGTSCYHLSSRLLYQHPSWSLNSHFCILAPNSRASGSPSHRVKGKDFTMTCETPSWSGHSLPMFIILRPHWLLSYSWNIPNIFSLNTSCFCRHKSAPSGVYILYSHTFNHHSSSISEAILGHMS